MKFTVMRHPITRKIALIITTDEYKVLELGMSAEDSKELEVKLRQANAMGDN